MLIDYYTLTDQDRDHWAQLERYDRALARALNRKVADAINTIRAFRQAHPDAICSTSWGKESMVVAHLTRRADPSIPLVWVPTIRADGISYESPPTYTVRDAFLNVYPGAYQERATVARNPKRGDPNYHPDQYSDPQYRSQDVLGEAITEPYISGVRAEESRIRAISIGHRGTTTARTCRPIGRWGTTEVFAYLAAHNLPVHPAYAATYGGLLDRRWLRVHPLRGKPPARSTIYGRDMDDWEDQYFPTLTTHQPRTGDQTDAVVQG